MKKIFVSIIGFTLSTIANAQELIPKTPTAPQLSFDNNIHHSTFDGNLIQSLVPLFAISLVVILLIQITRFILDYKLKNKIIDRNISEQLAASILVKSETDKKDETIKWAFLLLGLSGGLTLTYYSRPIDIHSVAIMAFSLGLSYLAYFLYLRR
jgi:hypothetical protein